MRVYIFQAALLCEACGEAVKENKQIDCGVCGGTHADLPFVDCRAFYPPKGDNRPLHPEHGTAVPEEFMYDSDDFPKGPYGDGGGEADTPQHCDHCGVFLENPLTADGIAYVTDVLKERYAGEGTALALWREFYADELPDVREELSDDLGESPDY